jgi:hypothetical protein
VIETPEEIVEPEPEVVEEEVPTTSFAADLF